MTKGIFAALHVYHDLGPRPAAMNMAIDEALLSMAGAPSIRFYRWNSPALSFGYFGKFADVADYAAKRDLVRRWTGGGIVLHGEDLTYSIIIPASAEFFSRSSQEIYVAIHLALRDALKMTESNVELMAHPVAGVSDPGHNKTETSKMLDACFVRPVTADVMVNGRKVAGAAQRRTRTGLLHQGSIQHVNLGEEFGEKFACQLTDNCYCRELNGAVIERATAIAAQKYATTAWLRKR
jgi:lipoate-protein ligase A